MVADTKLAIMREAERLFAERGFNGVSLREIAAQAGQRNVGSVQYHFKNKAGLIAAIFERRMQAIEAQRQAMFAAIDTNATIAAQMRALVAAVVAPLAHEIIEHGTSSRYVRFLALYLSDHSVFARRARQRRLAGGRVVARTAFAIFARIAELQPHVPGEVHDLRMRLLFNQVVHALADWERVVAEGGRKASETEAFANALIDYAARGIQAEVTPLPA